MADTVLQTELTLKDSTGGAIAGLQKGFSELHSQANAVSGSFLAMAKQAAVTAAGFQLSGGIDGIKKFAGEIMDAAKEANSQTKAIAGVLAVSDKTGASWEELRESAKGIRTDLEDIGTKWGASAAATTEAFEAIAARSSHSAEYVVDLVDKMAIAGRAVKGGLGGISEAFGMFEAGAIRAKNPIVQMITQTGVLKGNAKAVAQQLQKMKPEDAIKLGEAAIERMADRMKSVKPSFGEMLQSAKNIREQLMVTMGTPLLASLSGPMKGIIDYMRGHREEMEAYAKSAGEKIGRWSTMAFEKMSDAFKYVNSHAEEIEAALKEGWGYAKAVIDTLVRNKDLLKLGVEAYMLSKGVGAAGGAVGAVSGFMGGPNSMGGLMSKGMAAGAPSLGIAGGGAGAGVAAFGALGAAIASATWAAIQWAKLGKENSELMESQGDLKGNMEQLAKSGATEALDKQIASMREMDAASRETDSSLAKLAPQFAALEWAIRKFGTGDTTLGMAADQFDEYARKLHETAENSSRIYKEIVESLDDINPDAVTDTMDAEMTAIIEAYNIATQNESVAGQKYAADFLLHSGITKDMIVEAGGELAGGFGKFQELFAGAAGDTADLLKNFMSGGKHGGMGEIKAPQVHMGGGNTFNIKQDFRDQDPDRIVAIFKRDIVRAAEARHQSRLGAAFGGI